MIIPQHGKQDGHHGPGQHRQSYRTGKRNGHIKLHGAGNFVAHLPSFAFDIGGHNTGHQCHSHGGGNGNGQVHHLIVLRIKYTLNGSNGIFRRARGIHKTAEKQIVQRITDLVDGLAEHNGQDCQDQRPGNQPPGFFLSRSIPAGAQADLRQAPQEDHRHKQKGCYRAGQRSQRAAHGAPGGSLGRLSVHLQQRPGRHNAHDGVAALIHYLGNGRGHHIAAALGIAPHHAQKREQKGRRGQHLQRAVESRSAVQFFEHIRTEIEQTKRKRAHDQRKQQRHGQHP